LSLKSDLKSKHGNENFSSTSTLKTKMNLHYISRISLYHTVNTISFGFKNYSVNAVWSFFLVGGGEGGDPYKIQNVQFLNVQLVVHEGTIGSYRIDHVRKITNAFSISGAEVK
jgi:hypothetical protein